MRAGLVLLSDFNTKVARLERTRFAKRFQEQTPEVQVHFEDIKITDLGEGNISLLGRAESSVPGFDEDEIDAFVLTYRMLSQNNDRLSLARISELYESEWMPPEAAARFCEAREHLNKHLDSASTLDLGSYRIAIRDLVDVVIYGGLAHSNEKKSQIFKAWMSNGAISGFIWVEFQAAMREALRVFIYLRSLNNAVIDTISASRCGGH